MGGTGKLVQSLHNLMDRVGIDVVLDTDIAQINIDNNKALGATSVDGRFFSADRVICNGDPPTVYTQMLPSETNRSKRLFPEKLTQYSMGLYVLFFGTNKTYDDIAHHTIWMGPRYKELLADIFDRKILADDFSLYVHRPTATDSSFAPDGCDSFYVLCPVPNLRADIDWKKTGPIRFHNRDPHIDNLYFAAAGAHPGAGIPGVLSSAKVVESLVIEDEAKQLN